MDVSDEQAMEKLAEKAAAESWSRGVRERPTVLRRRLVRRSEPAGPRGKPVRTRAAPVLGRQGAPNQVRHPRDTDECDHARRLRQGVGTDLWTTPRPLTGHPAAPPPASAPTFGVLLRGVPLRGRTTGG
jgi:hypothetical protein